MGNFASTSIGRYHNDFELIVRATKGLEEILEKSFGAPDGKDKGMHDKITDARLPYPSGQPLPAELVRKLRKLVTIRNKLVHDKDFNAIPDRPAFVQEFDEVDAELRRLGGSEKQKGCTIC
ncbi:hypothetical protein T492DRAFT_241339 [Pavlovales sp. CCMP2436]|nr:hypothetical protein T492DRAFT_241339 [Pavlovales sp. CCMP2436]